MDRTSVQSASRYWHPTDIAMMRSALLSEKIDDTGIESIASNTRENEKFHRIEYPTLR